MKTTDVYLASALLALGFRLELVDRKDPRHMQFEFSDKNRTPLQESHLFTDGGKICLSENFISDVEAMWANRELTVNAFDFAEAIKRMKSVIHSGN